MEGSVVYEIRIDYENLKVQLTVEPQLKANSRVTAGLHVVISTVIAALPLPSTGTAAGTGAQPPLSVRATVVPVGGTGETLKLKSAASVKIVSPQLMEPLVWLLIDVIVNVPHSVTASKIETIKSTTLTSSMSSNY